MNDHDYFLNQQGYNLGKHEAQAEIDALKAENARLREALEKATKDLSWLNDGEYLEYNKENGFYEINEAWLREHIEKAYAHAQTALKVEFDTTA